MQEMPVLFIGHGSPMNAIEDNEFTREWKRIAADIPRPKAIVCISAHWLKEGTAVTAMKKPKTIHDFYGFPQELYRIRYPAKGSLDLASKIKKLVKAVDVHLDQEWGLDHGTWSVLNVMYPRADIPTLQLSLDYQLKTDEIFRLGRELKALRKEKILIICSGNLVHNLPAMKSGSPYAWAIEFDSFIKTCLQKGDYKSLINYQQNKNASLAHPTNDHYIPLIYAIGAAGNSKPKFSNEEIVFGSVSMRCVVFSGKGKTL